MMPPRLLLTLILQLLIKSDGWTINSHFSSSRYRDPHTARSSSRRIGQAINVIHAGIFGDVSDELRPSLEAALEREGWDTKETNVGKVDVLYRWNPKAKMLQLVDYVDRSSSSTSPPRWIKIEADPPPRTINGIPLESDPNKATKGDAANVNENYRPKWGDDDAHAVNDILKRSALGYSLTPMTFEEVISKAKTLNSDLSVQVLLLGGTDPPGRKITHNGVDLSASIRNLPDGIFACCLSGLPLFATSDLSPSTMNSDWLIFARPISPDHVILVESDDGSIDPRNEVLCAKSKCHLGYYSSKGGFCISASALDLQETAKLDPQAGMGDRNTARTTWTIPEPDPEPQNVINAEETKPEEIIYRPKWGDDESARNEVKRSALGYSLTPMTFEEVISRAKSLKSDLSVQVLLQGKTDPPGKKLTHNGFDLSESIENLPDGLFACCISGLPLFASSDLSPTTESSGWLTFRRPISPDHLLLVDPDLDDTRDPRIEVLDAKSKCHLGHYFGKEGFCINASVLNFIPVEQAAQGNDLLSAPVSYRSLESFEQSESSSSTSVQVLRDILTSRTPTKQLVLGGGPFEEVETALRRLPGVVRTAVGYAGGTALNPVHDEVPSGTTGHAEVVLVEFDPVVLEPRVLVDCFLSLHVPTKIRAYGKRAAGTGQHRSCIFVSKKDVELVSEVELAIDACRMQLGQDLSTNVYEMDDSADEGAWFWPANESKLRKEEDHNQASTDDLTTLSIRDWLAQYAKR